MRAAYGAHDGVVCVGVVLADVQRVAAGHEAGTRAGADDVNGCQICSLARRHGGGFQPDSRAARGRAVLKRMGSGKERPPGVSGVSGEVCVRVS